MNRVVEGFASVRLMGAENFSLHPKSIVWGTRERTHTHIDTRIRNGARVNLSTFVRRPTSRNLISCRKPEKGINAGHFPRTRF